MRCLQVFSLLFIIQASYAQSAGYISGIASDSIDRIASDTRAHFVATEFTESLLSSEALQNYWLERKTEVDKQEVDQNYWYSVVVNYSSKLRLKLLTKDSCVQYLALQNRLKQDLGDTNLVVANYYTIAAEINHRMLFDREAAIEAGKKSIKIRRVLDPDNYLSIANDLISMGYSYKRLKKFEESIKCMEEALVLSKKIIPQDTLLIMRNMYALGASHYSIREYDESLDLFREAYELGKQSTPVDHDVNITLVSSIGVVSEIAGDINSALEYAFKSLELGKLKSDNFKSVMHEFYKSIARISILKGEIYQANTYLDSAFIVINENGVKEGLASLINQKALLATNIEEEIDLYEQSYNLCQQEADCKNEYLHENLTNIAKAHERRGDYQSALNYALKSKNLQESDQRKNDKILPATYSLLANLYARSGQKVKAIEYAEAAVAAEARISKVATYQDAVYRSRLANYQSQNGETDIAESIYKNSLAALYESIGAESLDAISVSNNLSALYLKKEQYDSSLHYAQLSINSLKKNFDLKHMHFIDPLLYSSKACLGLGDKASCVNNINQVLSNCGFSRFDESINTYKIPDYKLWTSFSALFEVLKIEEELHDGNIDFLESKIKTGLHLISKLRMLYFFEVSEKEFQQNLRAFTNWSLSKLSKKYIQEKDDDCLALIFDCIEQSKSIMVNRNFVRTKSLQDEGLPEHLLEEEKSLLMEYQYYYDKYEAENNQTNDSLRNIFTNKMFDLEKEKQNLLDRLRQDYPSYYNDRYDQYLVSLETVQKYIKQEKSGLIIYHWGEEELFSILINPTNTFYQSIPINEVAIDINGFKDLVRNEKNGESQFDKNLKEFIKLSNRLYAVMIEPWGSKNLPFDLKVVPDGGLVNLPFDLLLTELDNDKNSYKDLSYLLRKHALGYLGSSSQLINKYVHKEKEKRYVGFAPDYLDQSSKVQSNKDLAVRTNTLAPLRYNTQEIEMTSDLFDGDKRVGKRATVSSFKELASSCDYLHLALHASVNDEYPLESHLSFASDDSTELSGVLAVKEISKMHLDNQLVVLSACETNVGSSVLGEGVLGIARAFNLASCPNLIMSSWVVDDKSSSKILFSFFENLLEHNDPAVSLRDAKLKYLKKSSKSNSHPAYWATFSYYGSPALVQRGIFAGSRLLGLFGISCLLAMAIFFGFRLLRK